MRDLTLDMFDEVPNTPLVDLTAERDFAASVFSEPLFQEIIDSKAFQRLKEIRFLGAIDYIFTPNSAPSNKRHTRYRHSLGVGFLALTYANRMGLDSSKTRLLVTAALLHDIGHGPLSHTLEPVFFEKFHIDHHLATAKIIRGDAPTGNAILCSLRRYSLDPDEIISLIRGEHSSSVAPLFASNINIDTIEAITRAKSYFSRTNCYPDAVTILEKAFIDKPNDHTVLDAFWKMKRDVYKRVINGKPGVLADYQCRKYMKNNLGSFRHEYFYLNEREFKKKFGKIFSFLHYVIRTVDATGIDGEFNDVPRKIEYCDREFIIRKDKKLVSDSDIDERYLEKKQTKVHFYTDSDRAD